MTCGALQREATWAEDRALLGSNPSADPGVGVEAGPGDAVRSGSSPFHINTKRKTQPRPETVPTSTR